VKITQYFRTSLFRKVGTRTRVVRNLSTAAIRFVRKVKVRWTALSGVVPVTIEMGQQRTWARASV